MIFGGRMDTCIHCKQEMPVELLLYDGIEPHVHSPKCRWCIIKEAQRIYGVENVILGNEN